MWVGCLQSKKFPRYCSWVREFRLRCLFFLFLFLETRKSSLVNLHSHQLAEGDATNYAAERSPPKRLKPVGFLSFHITDSSLALLPQDSQYVTTWLEELPVILPVNQWPTLLLQLKHGLNQRLSALSEDLINNGHEGRGREQDCGTVNNFYQMSFHGTSSC